jgi:hypothetical protein
LAHHKFLLTYPDGSRKHIDRKTRDQLLLSLQARQTGPQRYRFIAKPQTFHSFSEMGDHLYIESQAQPLRRFYPGIFAFELNLKRRRELMESPEGMAFRLMNRGPN